jgi:hypothetical protein
MGAGLSLRFPTTGEKAAAEAKLRRALNELNFEIVV